MEPNYILDDERSFKDRIVARWQYGGNVTCYDVSMVNDLINRLSELRKEVDDLIEENYYEL
jgi:hypothetical protein